MELIIIIIDTIIKSFQYAWFIILPLIILSICLKIKKKKIVESNDSKKLSRSIHIINLFLILMICTSRLWGPNFYKLIIKFSISGKETQLEQKLEQKYNKNFTFVSQGIISVDPYAGDALGQDITDDYIVRYSFKDDDGVIAIVEYKKNYQSDYYQSKRNKYEIERKVYDYANEMNFENEFYVFVVPQYEMINNSELTQRPSINFINKNWNNSIRIQIFMPEASGAQKETLKNLVKQLFQKTEYYIDDSYYVFSKEKYDNIVEYYESEQVRAGIEDIDFEVKYFINE